MTFSRKGRESLQTREERQEDDSQFESLFQQHWTRVCATVYRLVGDWSEAEDLALEAFVHLHRKPPLDEKNLGGWLYRVATHLGLNALRGRKRRQQYEEEAGYLVQADQPWDPAQIIEQAQERERVRAVLTQMKPRSAQLLTLRHSGLAYAEIAAALEIAPGSVGALLARAEQEFERLYRQQDPDGSRL